MGKQYILGIDEGTTSVRTVLYDTKKHEIVNVEKIKFTQYFPKPGWVEHDPKEIWKCTEKTLNDTLKKFSLTTKDIYGIGITNQRETTVAWNKTTLESPCHAIVWQCRRTADYCSSIKNKDEIKNRTGLIVDSYFSATKMRWMLNNVPEVRKLDRENNLCFGTIDTFLIAKLTKGKSFYTDVTNASRTMLYNINDLKWDEKLLTQFGININSLPEVKPCNYDFGMAQTIIGEIPILSVIGDQQASLFGQGCFEKGMAKNTYGTGCFILMNIGEQSKLNNKKLLKTIAWQIDDKINYALEGSIFNAGAALEWGNRLGLFKDSRETSALAESVGNNDGLYCVPAFTGLGAPYWDPKAKGIIYGITGGTTKAHVSRAILESMAYSTYDIIHTMESKHINVQELRVDGGVSKNDFLLQFQTNLIRVKLLRQESIEATVLGAIYMAGLNCGVFKNLKDISKHITFTSKFTPNMDEKEAKKLITGWHDAVKRCLNKG
ncbi:MAG: glycerol kinase GlpK [Eubacteriales bacterium]|nr:glycerol kinase GlpK [Eubacteriales bacterium]